MGVLLKGYSPVSCSDWGRNEKKINVSAILVAMSLPTANFSTSVLYYNGIVFPSGVTSTEGCSIRPKYDSSGRTVIYNEYSLTFKSILAGFATDSAMLAARRQLLKPGGQFIYEGRGIGGLNINIGSVRDVVWGPKPQELSFEPLGGPGIACRITWRVDVAIPDCSAARYQFKAMELCFAPTYTVTDGYTTRTLSGHLEIPQTRFPSVNSRILSESVDSYREKIDPPMVPGYRRRYGPWRINEAKTRLDFEIIDEEMGLNAPPEGCVKATLSHSVDCGTMGLLKWTGQFNADYELTKTADPARVAASFFATVKDRIGWTIDSLATNQAEPIKDSAGKTVIPVSAGFSEPDAYGQRRRATFRFGYTFTCPVKDILGTSGLWRPIPGSDWAAWAASLDRSALGPRGQSGLVFSVSDDRITDLCDTSDPVISRNAPRVNRLSLPYGPNAYKTYRTQLTQNTFTDLVKETFPPPKPEDSWVYYENEFFLEVDSGTVPLRLLPGEKLTDKYDIFGAVDDLAGGVWDALSGKMPTTTGGTKGKGTLNIDTIVQRRVKPSVVIFMTGRAARASYPVPVPRLLKVNGSTPVPANRQDRGEGYARGVKFAAGDTPIHTGRWNLRYYLPLVPSGELPVPPNPFLGESK